MAWGPTEASVTRQRLGVRPRADRHRLAMRAARRRGEAPVDQTDGVAGRRLGPDRQAPEGLTPELQRSCVPWCQTRRGLTPPTAPTVRLLRLVADRFDLVAVVPGTMGTGWVERSEDPTHSRVRRAVAHDGVKSALRYPTYRMLNPRWRGRRNIRGRRTKCRRPLSSRHALGAGQENAGVRAPRGGQRARMRCCRIPVVSSAATLIGVLAKFAADGNILSRALCLPCDRSTLCDGGSP